MKEGDLVIVNMDLTKTKNRFDLDSYGHMESMKGLCFKVESPGSRSNSIKIYNPNAKRSYMFDIEDLTLTEEIDESKEPEANPFKFDVSKL